MTKSYTVPATGRVPTRKFWIKYDQWWTELASEEVSKREKLTWIEAFGKFGLWIIRFTFLEDTRSNLYDPAIFQDSFHSWRGISWAVQKSGVLYLSSMLVLVKGAGSMTESVLSKWNLFTPIYTQRNQPNQNKTNETKATMPTILINQVSQPS